MVLALAKKRDQHRTVKKKKNSRCQTDSTKRVKEKSERAWTF